MQYVYRRNSNKINKIPPFHCKATRFIHSFSFFFFHFFLFSCYLCLAIKRMKQVVVSTLVPSHRHKKGQVDAVHHTAQHQEKGNNGNRGDSSLQWHVLLFW